MRLERSMSDITKIGNTSAKGSLHLFAGLIISNLVSAIGTIILLRVLGPSEFGLYIIALIPSTLLAVIRDFGMNFGITKYVSQYRVENKTKGVKMSIRVGLWFEVIIGALLSIISFAMASFFAVVIFNRSEIQLFLSIASVNIFSGALITASQSVFNGFEKMNSVA